MADKVEFELVSPEKLITSQPVDMVVVPGTEGDFGVLAGHAPMISTVRPGIIDVYEDDRVVNRVFVAGGFAEVTETRCTVLAEQAVPVADINRAEVEQTIQSLSQELDGAESDTDRAVIEGRLEAARAMLEAADAPQAAH
ncbi:F0F1 ATP synthase subunit epsilon [Azospirillum sp. SYSU D00513]|uniref:F0F1 ATP synthase subunit epsilon n=1 Tax=Azospirillum sp. SYSU D00513 TaxID=2812561 RepID=UPI001A968546|nr:F0F1 ATP synthase subunit epsilon [Azospirillum sp. SYSU D00513]